LSPDPETIERLLAAAEEVRENAYAPYSRYRVGAAVQAGGRVFAAPNVENASYPLSVCAERNAVAAAVAAGEREIEACAVVGGGQDPAPPCGGCRQVLHEFGPRMRVVARSPSGARREWTLDELLPSAFGPDDLSP
jgi:cytidine deaminase